jgi:hypothetical protein
VIALAACQQEPAPVAHAPAPHVAQLDWGVAPPPCWQGPITPKRNVIEVDNDRGYVELGFLEVDRVDERVRGSAAARGCDAISIHPHEEPWSDEEGRFGIVRLPGHVVHCLAVPPPSCRAMP